MTHLGLLKKFFALTVLGLACLAIVAEGKENKRQISSDDVVLAQRSFESFLRCDGQNSENQLLSCMKQFLTRETGHKLSVRYSFIFQSRMKISSPFQCDARQANLISMFEESKFDLYLCFDSDYSGEKKVGIVFFRTENGIPLISKIKL